MQLKKELEEGKTFKKQDELELQHLNEVIRSMENENDRLAQDLEGYQQIDEENNQLIMKLKELQDVNARYQSLQ